MAFVGQKLYELEQLAGWVSGLGILMGRTQTIDQGCSHLKVGLGLDALTWVQVSAGCWWEASVPHHVGLSSGLFEYLHDTAAESPPNECYKWPESSEREHRGSYSDL